MTFTALKGKHLFTYWYLITQINTSHSTEGEYIGCPEPTITDNTKIDQPETHSANSVTLQKMMAEQVQPDILTHLIIS